jgi:hypothetical protein
VAPVYVQIILVRGKDERYNVASEAFAIQFLAIVIAPWLPTVRGPCATPVPVRFLLFLSLSILPSGALAADWQQPTPDELR